MGTNNLLAILMGFSMETPFGMIRQLTYFVIIGLIEVPYPGNLLEFYKLVVELGRIQTLRLNRDRTVVVDRLLLLCGKLESMHRLHCGD